MKVGYVGVRNILKWFNLLKLRYESGLCRWQDDVNVGNVREKMILLSVMYLTNWFYRKLFSWHGDTKVGYVAESLSKWGI